MPTQKKTVPLHHILFCDPDQTEFDHSINLDGIKEHVEIPENCIILGSLTIENSGVISLPQNLGIEKHLYMTGSSIKKLPEGLIVGGNLYIDNSSVTHFPKNFKIDNQIWLPGTKVINYPVVYGCGTQDRVIYLWPNDQTRIQIGCFRGTRDEAIYAVKKRYAAVPDAMKDYVNKINQCFEMKEKLEQADLREAA